jgi:ankyrin repeat protein
MAAAAEVNFLRMSEAKVRQWVEANPGRVNERDKNGCTPLVAAVWKKECLSLVVWLLDEKGADANASTNNGHICLHFAHAPDIVSALLARGADPIRVTRKQKWSPLMRQALSGTVDVVARLLQDPRVRATINVQDVAQPFITPADMEMQT